MNTPERRSVLQDWVMQLPFMQQSVLIAAMRGPDGVRKDHESKKLCRWLRRCIVMSAFDRCALTDPYNPSGGSYTGPSIPTPVVSDSCYRPWEEPMEEVIKGYLDNQDSLPLHFHLHFVHAAEILGYKHENERIRRWWNETYYRFCHDMHMAPETEAQLDYRLDDDCEKWRKDASRFKR